jgi:hypothetical protein
MQRAHLVRVNSDITERGASKHRCTANPQLAVYQIESAAALTLLGQTSASIVEQSPFGDEWP